MTVHKKCVLKSPHKREDYNDYFEKRSSLGVNDLILSIETKHVYNIHAFLCKKVSESSAYFDCCCLHYMVKGI